MKLTCAACSPATHGREDILHRKKWRLSSENCSAIQHDYRPHQKNEQYADRYHPRRCSLIVFEGSFSILVSKNNNLLDLMLNEQLFKRYPVGTGKFGKTPAVDFFIYDKIIEPPWTRPADNRLIEYGDPENVLGTRWMALRSAENTSLKGFGIHGTWERDSIGAQSRQVVFACLTKMLKNFLI